MEPHQDIKAHTQLSRLQLIHPLLNTSVHLHTTSPVHTPSLQVKLTKMLGPKSFQEKDEEEKEINLRI